MKKIRQSVVFTLLIFVFQLQAGDHQWLKINHPTTDTRVTLQGQGIHYENFIWINKQETNTEMLTVTAQTINQPFHHQLDDNKIDLKSSKLPSTPWTSAPEQVGHDFYLLQFMGPVKTQWLKDISGEQIKLVSPLAPFSWIVWANLEQMNQLEMFDHVRSWNYLYPAFRVQLNNRTLASQPTETMALVYQEFMPQSIERLRALGAAIGQVRIINQHMTAITFTINGDKYLQAAQIPGVLTVQRIHTDGGARGEMSQQSIVGNYDGSNQVQTGYENWLTETGLDGTGVVVAVVDGGIYQNHPDLSNVIACTGDGDSCADASDSHGTHVAGAIGGTGMANSLNAAGFNRGLGVAPGVEIVEQLYGPLLGAGPGGMVAGGMLSIYKDSATSGALLSNNSWGPTGTPQGYDIPTMEVDMISRDANPDEPGNQPVLAVWSIMNGGGDRNTGLCSPSSLGSPDEAKNLFAIGSTKLQKFDATQIEEIFDISSNSAHGPACDGRQVPHIVAPGCRTEAPDSSTGYGMKCGTSMASPVMSGSIALFWEQYRNEFSVEPSPALIKAVFTAVADDLDSYDDANGNEMGHAPDRKQGWGRVNLDAVVNPETGFWFYDQATIFTESGQSWQQAIVPINPQLPIRMMLVWTDAPGAGLGGTNPAWVNDLDLSVTVFQTFLGNQFGSNGYSALGGVADSMNNMEAVFLTVDQHQGQLINIEVMASNVVADALNPFDPGVPQQDFALACHNCQPAPQNSDLIFADGFE